MDFCIYVSCAGNLPLSDMTQCVIKSMHKHEKEWYRERYILPSLLIITETFFNEKSIVHLKSASREGRQNEERKQI